MSFKMPSTNQVCELGDSLGTDVTGDYANSFINFVQSFAGGHGLLASLPDDVPAIKDPRGPSYRPEGDDNSYGAWIAKTHIKGASSGKLAGKNGRGQRALCRGGYSSDQWCVDPRRLRAGIRRFIARPTNSNAPAIGAHRDRRKALTALLVRRTMEEG
jgi:hypothetical protein